MPGPVSAIYQGPDRRLKCASCGHETPEESLTDRFRSMPPDQYPMFVLCWTCGILNIVRHDWSTTIATANELLEGQKPEGFVHLQRQLDRFHAREDAAQVH